MQCILGMHFFPHPNLIGLAVSTGVFTAAVDCSFLLTPCPLCGGASFVASMWTFAPLSFHVLTSHSMSTSSSCLIRLSYILSSSSGMKRWMQSFDDVWFRTSGCFIWTPCRAPGPCGLRRKVITTRPKVSSSSLWTSAATSCKQWLHFKRILQLFFFSRPIQTTALSTSFQIFNEHLIMQQVSFWVRVCLYLALSFSVTHLLLFFSSSSSSPPASSRVLPECLWGKPPLFPVITT